MHSTSAGLIFFGITATSYGQITGAPAVVPAVTQAVAGADDASSKTGDFVPETFHATKGTNETWQIAAETLCTGSQQQYGECIMSPCEVLETIDCVFAQWSDWGHCDCTGLHSRSRVILTTNNERGNPCDGDITQTQYCPPPCKVKINCVLSEWTQWSDPCKEDPHAQKVRTRTITTEAQHGGEPCEGCTQETLPCSTPEKPVPCTFEPWEQWSSCSSECDVGTQTRHRNIGDHAANGGEACSDRLKELKMCHGNSANCGAPEACVLGQWSPWSGCNDANPLQKTRHRSVSSPAREGGDGCGLQGGEDGVLKEISLCVVQEVVPEDCALTPWEAWSECDKTCEGGQQFRTRKLLHPPRNGGECDQDQLRETRPCNIQPCSVNAKDCELSEWQVWSDCSATCGIGQKRRSREVLSLMEIGGKGCDADLTEVDECKVADCSTRDCQWGQWQEWSGCTCSCDGGSMMRNRQIEIAPENGGALCEAGDKTEVAACNTQPCAPQKCVDAQWGEWLEWGECSASCGLGFRKRKRLVEIEATACGTPVSGTREMYKNCSMGSCGNDVDCQFDEWQEWSDCSCPCYGVREQSRRIKQYSEGKGKSCLGGTKRIEPCNPSVVADGTFDQAPPDCDRIQPPQDCTMDSWGDWSECQDKDGLLQKCGGGHMTRKREILTPNRNGGNPCHANLTEIIECPYVECVRVCQDCSWGQWSEWSVCSSDGQKRRQRQIDHPADYCGVPCAMEAATTVSKCEPPVSQDEYCVWSSWEEWTPCSATCGASEQSRTRELTKQTSPPADSDDLMYKGDASSMSMCFGRQTNKRSCQESTNYQRECPDTCDPQNCQFGAWGSWHDPSCEGLCVRSRVVDTINNRCGDPCDGPLIVTKKCWDKVNCGKPVDCMWEQWSDWSVCNGDFDHRQRTRNIGREPKHGGLACNGTAQEVKPCGSSRPPPEVNCEVSTWAAWTTCSKTCGGGTQTRSRYLETSAQNGGLPCTEGLKELQDCALNPCPTTGRDCQLSVWSSWSACIEGQQNRHRSVDVTPEGTGQTCADSLAETRACQLVSVDCVLSLWTDWNSCDKSCDGGQKRRHREVKTPPSNGGKDCDENLRETSPCNMSPCVLRVDCELSSWGEWSTPAVTCGDCQQWRKRTISQQATAGGFGCLEQPLNMTRGCHTSAGEDMPPCLSEQTNCVWNDWGEWDACSCPCGGGTQRRTRTIKTAPRGGGLPCDPHDKLQVHPCNTQSCEACRDGKWSSWSEWTDCSRSCGGGTRKRSRRIVQDANDCGKPVEGDIQEINACALESCEKPVDCLMNSWTEWSACSCTCFGTRSRSRSIGTQGRGDGLWCNDDTRQVQQCNPLLHDAAPDGCITEHVPVDCSFAEWSEWQECSVSCGKGQQVRTRQVATKASNGGAGCNGAMQLVQPCTKAPCETKEKTDCVWNDWGEWSACTKCAGQSFRTRTIRQMNEGGGTPCPKEAGQQTRGCEKRECHADKFCAWDEWEEWEQCSVSCGTGRRQRSRKLVVTNVQPEPEQLFENYARQNAELRRKTQSVESGRVQELAVSFVAGALSLVVVFSLVRGTRSRVVTTRTSSMHAAGSPLFIDEAVE